MIPEKTSVQTELFVKKLYLEISYINLLYFSDKENIIGDTPHEMKAHRAEKETNFLRPIVGLRGYIWYENKQV